MNRSSSLLGLVTLVIGTTACAQPAAIDRHRSLDHGTHLAATSSATAVEQRADGDADERAVRDDNDDQASARRRRSRATTANNNEPPMVEQIPQGQGPLDAPPCHGGDGATNVQLGSQPVTVDVPIPNAGSTRLEAGTTTVAIDPPAAGARTLHLSRLRSDVSSGAYYRVYLGRVDARHLVGMMHLYDAHVRDLEESWDAPDLIRRVAAEGGPWRVIIVEDIPAQPGENPRFERVFFANM